jgi:hypothetical protein
MNTSLTNFNDNGFAIIHDVYTSKDADILVAHLTDLKVFAFDHPAAPDPNLLKSVPAVREIAHSQVLKEMVASVLGAQAKPVSAFILDKTNASNWLLEWHQDLRISVKEQKEIDGYSNWNVQTGKVQVIPPVEVLQNMLAVRIHLDDCDEQNGAILALPGTHRQKMNGPEIETAIINKEAYTCIAPKGAVMLMSPLLLHRSPYSSTAKPRRVLHIELTTAELPGHLQWA